MAKAIKAYKLRIYPTNSQESELNFLMRMARLVYNAVVEQRHRAYRQKLPIATSYYSQRNRLCRIRNRYPERLGRLSAATVDAIIRKIESAWKGAFTRWRQKGVAEFPEEKSRVYSIPFPYKGGGVKYMSADGARYGRLRVMSVSGLVRVREHRALPKLPIKQISIRSDKDGKWFASFTYEESAEVPCIRHAPPVGIDLGLKSRLAVSDGMADWTLNAPRWMDIYEAQHRRIDRALSRCKRGSNRRKRVKAQRAKLASKIARCRADWLHNATTWLAESFEHIYCEDLQPQFMLKNKHIARSAADAAFGELKRMLIYKCGDRVTFVNPAYTTQACSRCGVLIPKELSERVHRCGACGLELDRDINAARNVLALGRKGKLLAA